MDQGWIAVGKIEDIAAQQNPVITYDGEAVLLHRVGDVWHAFSMACPHKGGLMRQIDIRGDVLACPLHAWLFDLNDRGRERHDYGDLMAFETKVEDDQLFIRV
ncbi:Rieske (2Fe-2S) protein [Mycolicibacterium sp.]|uniref:Rieske (2Fe-2S) protein n=1 Tax=Mycolicibacterium sp. TaxID=2320850 RepID=UPI003D0ED3D2